MPPRILKEKRGSRLGNLKYMMALKLAAGFDCLQTNRVLLPKTQAECIAQPFGNG